MRDRFQEVFATPPPPGRRKPWRLATQAMLRVSLVVLVVPFAALIAAIATFLMVVTFQAASKREPPPADVPGPLRNIHSLALNPADGLLYVATLSGVFRIEAPDRALRLGGSYQNSTGLIAVGPDEFLAGGRSDFRDIISGFAKREAGLIRSTDAGRSWKTESLAGRALFTVLSLNDGVLYGYDELTGTFRARTPDGRTWDDRSRLEGVIDFAVDPAGRQTVVATTETAVLYSADGGRAWSPRESPALLFLEWPLPDELWAVGGDGSLLLSRDSGDSWERRGTAPGTVTAFHVDGQRLFVGLKDNRILASGDGGRTWDLQYQDAAWQPLPDFSSD